MVYILLIYEDCRNVSMCSHTRLIPYIYIDILSLGIVLIFFTNSWFKAWTWILPYGPPYITYSSLLLLGANLFCSCQYQNVLARTRGIHLSTFKILLLSFNKTDFIKRTTFLNESKIEHFINMHLSTNWLSGGARVSEEYGGWLDDITTVCFNVLWSNDCELDGRFTEKDHSFV